jgi:2-phospho-L-lactate/phosphoenolpyruvate guanylyltransferase
VLAPLVPVKRLADAKGRLAPQLGPIERRLLAIAMFEDVVAALLATDGLAAPVVVSPDQEVWRRAAALGCTVAEEAGGGDGLNDALRRAAPSTGALLVVSADLPLATAVALGRVRDALERASVVVVPSHDQAGTNVLGWRDAATFAPAFGAGSAARHLAAAGALRLDDAELGLDVDTAADLRAVVGRLDAGTVTASRVRDLRLADRLASGDQDRAD